MAEVEVLRDAAVLVEGTRIAAVGAYRRLRAAHRGAELAEVRGVLSPGLIDCHTHAVFGAPRLDDHERRALGEDYKAIAAQGGGILQSVADVRARPLAELVALTRARVATLLAHGSTTIEVKSGYGLELEAEVKQLRVIREVAASVPVTLVPTFLGAHEVPPEFRDRRADYVRLVCEEMIPAVARERLAVACDVFCEPGVFSVAEALTAVTGNAAAALGLAGERGQIAAGFAADLVVCDVSDWRELAYWLGPNLVSAVWTEGSACFVPRGPISLGPHVEA